MTDSEKAAQMEYHKISSSFCRICGAGSVQPDGWIEWGKPFRPNELKDETIIDIEIYPDYSYFKVRADSEKWELGNIMMYHIVAEKQED